MTDRIAPLDELVTIAGGGTPDRSEASYWGTDVPWATVKDLVDLDLSATQESITRAGLANSASTLVPAGSVIVATRMALGKAVINSVDVAINQDLKALTCSPDLEPRYLLYFLLSQAPRLVRMGKGATVKGITLDRLRELSVPLPSLHEQRRIATLLDKTDAVRRKRREGLRLTDELLSSMFQDLFGDATVNQKDWDVARLGECLMTKPTIGTITPATDGGKTRLIRVGELGHFEVALDRCGFVTIPMHDLERFQARAGDLVLARAIGSEHQLGKASVVPPGLSEPVVFDSHVMRLRCNPDRILAPFLWQWLQSPGGRRLFLKHGGRTAVQFNINASQISDVRIPLPPIENQERFIALANSARNLRAKQAGAALDIDTLFDSLAQRAFGAHS